MHTETILRGCLEKYKENLTQKTFSEQKNLIVKPYGNLLNGKTLRIASFHQISTPGN